LATKKRSDSGDEPKPAQRKTGTKTSATSRKRAADAGESSGEGAPRKSVVKAAVKTGAKKAARPQLRASHSSREAALGQGGRRVVPRPKGTAELRSKAGAGTRKAPLAAPKRTAARKQAPQEPAKSASRELSLAIAAVGLDKKALGVEILDVRGRVDYADFLVLMTGRSDRHVSAIAQGIEQELSKKKLEPISVEGMQTSTWVLLDYADVVVHVFQEDARQLYDIEGLWMDASRINVPGAEAEPRQARDEKPSEDEEEPPSSV